MRKRKEKLKMVRRNELQAMRHHVRELENTIYATQECIKETCNVCDYNTICKATVFINITN